MTTAGRTLEGLAPRLIATVGLLAIVPVVWYGFGRSLTAGLFAAVNVAIVIGVLWVVMGPLGDEEPGEDSAAT